MLIFTPRAQFDSGTITSIQILGQTICQISGEIPPRLSISANRRDFLFYGQEAFEVIDQLADAGYYRAEQAGRVRVAMEQELSRAGMVSA